MLPRCINCWIPSIFSPFTQVGRIPWPVRLRSLFLFMVFFSVLLLDFFPESRAVRQRSKTRSEKKQILIKSLTSGGVRRKLTCLNFFMTSDQRSTAEARRKYIGDKSNLYRLHFALQINLRISIRVIYLLDYTPGTMERFRKPSQNWWKADGVGGLLLFKTKASLLSIDEAF